MKDDFDELEFPFLLLVGSKTNRLELMSALHSLIKRDKITTAFNESKRYFTDYDFMVDVVDNCNSFVGVENALYKSAMEGNVTAQIYWLKCRKKEKWGEEKEQDNSNKTKITIVNSLPKDDEK